MSTTLLDELRSGTAPSLMPITVDQLHQMIKNGILHDGDPIELIDGLLVRKDRSARGENLMGHNPRHALLIKRVLRLLMAPCESAGWHVQVQLPVMLNEFNVPEPDIAVVQGTEEDFADHHPGPEDLALVVEIADSSLGTDRSTKQRLYATAGVPRYWLINLQDSQVEVFEQPDSGTGRYARQTTFLPNQTLIWELSPTQQVEISVGQLLR